MEDYNQIPSRNTSKEGNISSIHPYTSASVTTLPSNLPPDGVPQDEVLGTMFYDESAESTPYDDILQSGDDPNSNDLDSLKQGNGMNDCCRLFIGQIPPGGGKELYNRMSAFGEIVEFVILKNREDQSHTGAGFCIFREPSAARNAKEALHDKVMLPGAHQKLVVKLSKRDRQPPVQDFAKLFVGNIPPNIE